MPGEDVGRRRVGQPAAIAAAERSSASQRLLGVADAVDVERQAEPLRRAEQKGLELRAALVVAPIADPDEAAPLGLARGRVEHVVSAASCQTKTRLPQPQRAINLGQGLAEGEHAVVAARSKAWIASGSLTAR